MNEAQDKLQFLFVQCLPLCLYCTIFEEQNRLNSLKRYRKGETAQKGKCPPEESSIYSVFAALNIDPSLLIHRLYQRSVLLCTEWIV